MKDLQWILDTAASAYEKRFMKKNIIFFDIYFYNSPGALSGILQSILF